MFEENNFTRYYAYRVFISLSGYISVWYKCWSGTYENAIKPLTIQQNKIVRMCLDKNTLVGSTKLNYKHFGVLLINLLYTNNLQFCLLLKRFP